MKLAGEMSPNLGFIFVLKVLLWAMLTKAEEDWTPEFLAQTRESNCIPGRKQHDVTFLHGTASGDFTKLGKVADMDVCMLLCCERDECEAAFMADHNCYAVKCRTQEHCVTAPARNNQWHPLVAFVKRIADDVTGENANSSQKADDRQTLPQGKLDSPINQAANSKMSGTDKKSDVLAPLVGGGERVAADGRTNSVIRLEEVNKKADVRIADNPKEARRQRELRKAKFSIISAAVATCLMACVLSGMAVLAAKIRQRREQTDGHEEEYSSVPTHD